MVNLARALSVFAHWSVYWLVKIMASCRGRGLTGSAKDHATCSLGELKIADIFTSSVFRSAIIHPTWSFIFLSSGKLTFLEIRNL